MNDGSGGGSGIVIIQYTLPSLQSTGNSTSSGFISLYYNNTCNLSSTGPWQNVGTSTGLGLNIISNVVDLTTKPLDAQKIFFNNKPFKYSSFKGYPILQNTNLLTFTNN